MIKKYFVIAALIFFGIIILMTIHSMMGCQNPVKELLATLFVEKEEISRISSPDRIVDAVLIRSNGGATTSFDYKIFICPKGEAPRKIDECFNAVHADSLKMTWKSEQTLEIYYEQAAIFHFTNYWCSSHLQNGEYIVELKLAPKNNNHLLPNMERQFDEKGNRRKIQVIDINKYFHVR